MERCNGPERPKFHSSHEPSQIESSTTPWRTNSRRPTRSGGLFKLPKIRDGERVPNAGRPKLLNPREAREKGFITYKGFLRRVLAKISAETLQSRR